ncbi:MAG: ImmA/IrrE family metallo-endopeptidase [Candidatus Heimdallarchaeaceae archaeon]
MQARVNINVNLLEWALNRPGINKEAISRKFPNLNKWLTKEKKPTVKQLSELSKKLSIPFGLFFIEKPEPVDIEIPYYRTNKDVSASNLSVDFIDIYNIIKYRQEWVRDYLINIGAEPLDYVGKHNHKDKIEEVANDIRKILKIDTNWASNFNSWIDSLKFLIEKIESVGIFTSISSIVGNNTRRKLDVNEFRGFVIVDEYAPFIFINGSDSKSAQMFTIAHELAHILIGKSAAFDLRYTFPAKNEIEEFCNKVAAEFLVPAKDFLDLWHKYKGDPQPFKRLSHVYKVSEIVVARRALDLNIVNKTQFIKFYENYIKKEKIVNKRGGDFYSNQIYKIGKRLSMIVYQAVRDGSLLYSNAYRLIDLYGETFDNYYKKLSEYL